MKNKICKRLVAIMLTLSISISLLPLSTVTTSAAIGLASLGGWATNQFYTRCLSISGNVLESIGSATGNETITEITSFINNTFCGGSDTGEKLNQLQNTCNEILETTKNVESI